MPGTRDKSERAFIGKTLLLFLVIFVPCAIIIITTLTLFFKVESRNELKSLKLKQMSKMREAQNFMVDVLLAGRSEIYIQAQQYIFKVWDKSSENEKVNVLSWQFFDLIRHRAELDQVRFVDAYGKEIVRVDNINTVPTVIGRDQLQNISERSYFKKTIVLGYREYFVSRFDLNQEYGAIEIPIKPTIRFATPVFDGNGNKIGIIVINFLGKNILSRFEDINFDEGKSLLLNQDGYFLISSGMGGEWNFMYDDRKEQSFANKSPKEWQKIFNAYEGQFISNQGLYSFATVLVPDGVPSAPFWKIASFVPSAVLTKSADRYLTFILYFGLALLVFAAIGSWIIAQTTRKHKLARKETEIYSENQTVIKDLLKISFEELTLEKKLEKALGLVLSIKRINAMDKGGIYLTERDMPSELSILVNRNLPKRLVKMYSKISHIEYSCGRAPSNRKRKSRKTEKDVGVAKDHNMLFKHISVPITTGDRCFGVMILQLYEYGDDLTYENDFMDSIGQNIGNIVASHRSKEALQKSEVKMRTIMDTAAEGIITIDTQDSVQSFNAGAEKIFGYKASEIVGEKVNKLFPESYRSYHGTGFHHYLLTGGAEAGEARYEMDGCRKSGERFPLLLSISEVNVGDEQIFTLILYDITSIKEAENKLKAEREKLNKANIQLMEKQKKIDDDLHAAAQIQQMMLSKSLNLDAVNLAFKFVPSDLIGGDIYDAFLLSKDHLAIYILDVSGHGVPAAMVTMSVHEMLMPSSGKVINEMNDDQGVIASPQYVVEVLDREYPVEKFEKTMTIFYAIINLLTGHMVYCNAGHPPPILIKKDGSTEMLKDGGGLIGFGGILSFDEGSVILRRGDKLILYTDGIIEYEDERGDFFGTERLKSLIVNQRLHPVDDLVNLCWQELMDFGGNKKPDDDVSIMAAEFLGYMS